MAGAVDDRATRRSNYPVRVQLPASRPATTPPPPSRGRVVDDGGSYGAGARIRRAAGDATKGVFTRALMDTVRAIPGVGPLIAPAVPLVTTQPGRITARNFVDGLTGAPKGGARVPLQPAAPAAARTDPVAASMAAGRTAAAAPITPHDRMLAQLDTILGSNRATMSDLQAVSGMLPDRANLPDAKDTVLGTTAQVSQSVYADAIADIAARKAAGTLTSTEAKAETAKATDAYFLRNTALVANPLSYAQANMLPTDEELEQ